MELNQIQIPAPYVVIDVETKNLTAELIAAERQFLKADSRIKDPEKIRKNLTEQGDKLIEKGALSDSAPLGCVGVKADRVYAFTTSPLSDEDGAALAEHQIAGLGFEGERAMLTALGALLGGLSDPETIIVGFNHLSFDLPKLRLAFVRNGVKLPACLSKQQPVYDVMREFVHGFSTRPQPFMSLGEVAFRLGLTESGRKVIEGCEIPGMFDDGRVLEVLLYNALDLALTERAFLMMSNAL